MAFDASGDTSPLSTGLDFTPSIIRSDQLPAPTNLSPSGVVTSAISPTFQWDAVAGNTGYILDVVDQTLGTELIEVALFPTQNYYSPSQGYFGSPLISGHQYRYYVSSRSGSNEDRTGLVASQTFTFAPPSIDVARLTSPAAGATVTSATPTFTWSAVPGASGYLVYISDPNGYDPEEFFLTSAATVNVNSYVPSNDLLDGHTYQWQVCPVFTTNGVTSIGPTSDPIEFNVSVPGTTTLDAKDDSGTLNTATPTLQWSPVPGASGYDLFLQDTTTGTQVFDPLPVTTTSFAVIAPLNNGDTYQWDVTAFDNFGNVGLAPPALTFTVAVTTVGPPTPTLKGPIGKTKIATPIFQWTPVPNAVGYSLYLKDTTTSQILYPGIPVNGLMYTPPTPLADADSYDWYVRAIYSDGTLGPAPPGADFGISDASDLAGPPTPTFANPLASGATPTFQWSPVANATGYQIEVFDTTNGKINSPQAPITVNATSYTAGTPLTPGHTYQWEVAAFDASGQETAWSKLLTFRVAPPVGRVDFDGDGKADLAVYGKDPSPGSTTSGS